MPLLRDDDLVHIDLPEAGEWVKVKRRPSRGDRIAVQKAVLAGARVQSGQDWSLDAPQALEAAEFAMEHGDPWRFHKAMFKAYFEDLKNIGDIDTVIGVGEEAGLDAGSLRAALDEGRYRQHVDEGIAWSRSIGVTAIPTFVFNERYGMVGAQEQEAFRTMMEKLGQAPRT